MTTYGRRRTVKVKVVRARRTRGRKKIKQMYRRTRNIARAKIGFPTSSLVRMRYVENLQLNLQNQTQYTYVFRANSLYDPNASGTGGQPYGYDEFSNYYNRYTVLGAKIRLVATKNDQDYSDNIGVPILGMGIYKANSLEETKVLTIPQLQERGLCKVKVLSSNTSGKNAVATTYATYSAKKWWKITNPMDETFGIGAPVVSNPTRLCFFIVNVGPLNGIAMPNQNEVINYNVQIDYIVRFSEPNIMASS